MTPMPASQINITLGTAGHIDHGKTALIKCLTGCDTDHLKAEKQRGMSIELGFAPCLIADTEVGIVDVPGHENFIKTMVAGATGIDGVIFVIAADDGVMPQTREHLDILTLLGVQHGLVALTKIDTVSTEHTNKITAEVKNFLKDTFLQAAPILPLSSTTGAGFPDFLDALKQLIARISPKPTDGLFRLPVERTFSPKGFGTVVSGIPVSGSAEIGDELILLPQNTKGRIKAIQVYSKNADTVLTGQCAALNIPQFDYKSITRGNVVTVAKYFTPSQWFLCKLKLLPCEKLHLKNGSQIKFHTGTSEVVATVYLMESNDLAAGSETLVQLRLEAPIVAAPADRFIIRLPSPAQTIGGGFIVEALAKKLKRTNSLVIRDANERANAVADEKSFTEYCVKSAPDYAASVEQISLRTKIPQQKLKAIIAQLTDENKILPLTADLYIHTQTATTVEQKLIDILTGFHNDNPQSPGITLEKLLEASTLNKNIFDPFIKKLLTCKKLLENKNCIALPTHTETFDTAQQKLIQAVEKLLQDNLFNPPKPEEIAQITQISPEQVNKTIRILVEQQRIARVDKDLYFHIEAVEEAKKRLTEHIEQNGLLESVKFKYLLDTSRKFAIPLLDYMDKIGVTRRLGNTRYLKK
jgi:selenocysteine-specific elongation factor